MPELNLGKVVGPQGPQGAAGPAGPEGKQGPQGATGEAGKSAYQAAKDGGYTGTEGEFNAILAIIERHAGRHKTGGADPLTAADVGAAPASNLKLKIANDLSHIGVTQSLTMSELLAALPTDIWLMIANNTDNSLCVTDTPGKYGLLSVKRRYNTYTEVTWMNATGNTIASHDFYFGNVINNSWSGWKQFATTDYALPRDGSAAMTGILSINNSDSIGVRKHRTINDEMYTVSLGLFNDGGGMSGIELAKTTSLARQALLALREDKLVVDFKGVRNEVLHTGNKPSGSYTGDGGRDEFGNIVLHQVPTGGIGNVVLIYSKNAFVLADENGAYTRKTGSVELAFEETVKFINGNINIRTDSSKFNTSGEKYYYIVP